ncbi:hypothetical protein AMECASPLE_010086 [Ameca splendens]|uniref:Uncharacterized protein n=1 Tax=Ameca splendens TaxID=208324 RepID=A0ABV0YYY9_9TELE
MKPFAINTWDHNAMALAQTDFAGQFFFLFSLRQYKDREGTVKAPVAMFLILGDKSLFLSICGWKSSRSCCTSGVPVLSVQLHNNKVCESVCALDYEAIISDRDVT